MQYGHYIFAALFALCATSNYWSAREELEYGYLWDAASYAMLTVICVIGCIVVLFG